MNTHSEQDSASRDSELEALAASEELLRLAVEGARLGTWRWNLIDDSAHYSEHSARLFGLPPGQSLDRAMSFRNIHRDDRALVASAIEHALAHRSDFEFEFRAVWPDGSHHWLISRGHGSYREDGKPLRMDGVMWDIDARKRAEQDLRRSEQRYRGLFECMREGFMIADALYDEHHRLVDWRLVDINPSGCEQIGRQREQVVGHTVSACFPDLEAAWYDAARRAQDGSDAIHYRGYYAAVQRHFDARFHALKPDQLACVFKDVTALLRAQSEHQRLEAQFMRAQKMEAIGQLTGGIAHDFNNILTGVLGYGKLALLNKELPAEGKLRNYLNEMVNGAERAADLVAKMQAFSRGPGAGAEGEAHTTRAVIEDIVRLLRTALPATMEVEPRIEDIPELPVPPADMHQLLTNLVVNARDAIREVRDVGCIGIHVLAPRECAQTCSDCRADFSGRFVEVAVSDNGCGIAPDRLPMIFDPFYTSKEVGKGTGLGLSVVHGIVHGAGGHIVIEARPEGGTVMRLLFPV